MPYIIEPRWAAEAERALRIGMYTLVLGGSIAAMIAPPPTLFNQFSHAVIVWASAMMGVFSLPALYGAVRRLYRYEWVAVWFIASGIGCYATAAWARSVDDPSRILASCNLTIAFIFFVLRGIQLTVVARKKRAERRLLG